jgi:hypothetical protein
MRKMTWHEEVLGARQHRALLRLGASSAAARFYLGGGTAIALRLGHRRSQDFDFFTQERFDEPIQLATDLHAAGVPFVAEETARATLYGRVYGTRTSFFRYPYDLLQSPSRYPAFGCRVAHLDDLAAMKLIAVAQRGSKKDFVDLYALCRRYAPLAPLLKKYEKKYRLRADSHLAMSLTYFEDADREPMPRMVWKVRWPEIKQAFREWIKDLAG